MSQELREQKDEKRYGIRLADLTDSVLIDVVEIYDRVVGANKTASLRSTPSEVEWMVGRTIGDVEQVGSTDWRFGSRLTHNSKLSIFRLNRRSGIIRFEFDPNVNDPRGAKPEEEQLTNQFRDEVEKYLLEKGLAVPI